MLDLVYYLIAQKNKRSATHHGKYNTGSQIQASGNRIFLQARCYPCRHALQAYTAMDLLYDGYIHSLEELSRKPHAHPNMHTEAELKLIGNYMRRNPSEGLVGLWVKLKRREHNRSLSSLYRLMQIGSEIICPAKLDKTILCEKIIATIIIHVHTCQYFF